MGLRVWWVLGVVSSLFFAQTNLVSAGPKRMPPSLIIPEDKEKAQSTTAYCKHDGEHTDCDLNEPENPSIVQTPAGSSHTVEFLDKGKFKTILKLVDKEGCTTGRACTRRPSITKTEFSIWSSLKDIPEVLTYQGEVKKGDYSDHFFELASHGNLSEFNKSNVLPLTEIAAVLNQLLKGIASLHARGVLHRDVKPANILITSITPLRVKISDFGSACQLTGDSGEGWEEGLSDVVYRSPSSLKASKELLMSDVAKAIHDQNSDIWGVGLIVLELIKHSSEPWQRGATSAEDLEEKISLLEPSEIKQSITEALVLIKREASLPIATEREQKLVVLLEDFLDRAFDMTYSVDAPALVYTPEAMKSLANSIQSTLEDV